MEVGNPSEFDLLKKLLENLPDAGSERERRLHRAARCLSEFVGKEGRSLPADPKELALRLTRDALFDLYQGFRLGTFRGISGIPRSPGEPSAAQIRLRERLEMLARVEDTRDEMFRWFLAGLRHEIGRILRERLQSAPRTWDPRRLFTRWRGRVALALEQAFRAPVDDQNPEHEFGLYGLHLLFESTGKIAPQEFQALSDLMTRWVEDYFYFPELEIRDLVRTMAWASLSPEQTQELADRLLSWRDLERYPAERSFTSLRKEVQAKARAMGYGQAMIALTVLLASLFRLRSFPNPLGEEYQRYREEINRRRWLASALAGLALQDVGYLPAVAGEIDALLGMDAQVEARYVLMDALPAFLRHPTHLALLLETLSRHGFEPFDEMHRDDLRDLHLQISQETLEALLDLSRCFPQVQWLLQILENAGALAPQAEEWLIWQVQDGEDDLPTKAIIALHQRLFTPQRSLSRVENALLRRVRRSLQNGLPVSDDVTRWMLSLKDKVLHRLLADLAQRLKSDSLQVTPSLSNFLRALAVQVCYTEHPNIFKLAACWLADPDDGLGIELPLPKRLDQAVGILKRQQPEAEVITLLARIIPRENPALTAPGSREWGLLEQRVISTCPRLASVLLEGTSYWHKRPMYAGADRRLALVRALGRSQSPEHALSLLADLFQLAVEMHVAWYEADGMPRFFPKLKWEADALVAETLKAVAQLKPVLPQAVALIEKILLAQYEMPEGGFSGPTLSPGTITQEILPLLVERHLTSETVPALVELLEHEHPPEEKHTQCIWQIALQWLSNTSDLSAEQQEVVWRVGYASPLILTRALALLVLGRQRPIPPRTWETVLNLVCKPSRRLHQDRFVEITRLNDRSSWFILGPGDVFLVSGVAIALTAEWFAERGLLTDEQKNAVRQAWSLASSELNRTLEARLAKSTHPNTPKSWSYAKGLTHALCHAVGKKPDDDPDWLVRPADLARNLLLTPANHSQ